MFAWLESLTGACVPVLLDAAVKGTALLVAAGLLTLCMRRTSAAPRHAVWLLAMGGLLALPLLSTTLPGWRILPNWCHVEVTSELGSAEEQARTDHAVSLSGSLVEADGCHGGAGRCTG